MRLIRVLLAAAATVAVLAPAPLGFVPAATAVEGGLNWNLNRGYAEMLAQAKGAGRKHLLVVFTGKDWCPPCKQLEANVFSSPGFATLVAGKVELLMLDFPRATPRLPANLKTAEQFNIEGFPTVALIDTATGKEVWRDVGYSGDPKAWLNTLKTKAKL